MLSPEDWKRLEELFHRACDMPRSARANFVHAQAGDHPELRIELEKMLDAADMATERLQEPMRGAVARLGASETPELEAGTRFGPWQVDRLIGKGGMGYVYLGHRADGAYERQVAIKVIGGREHSARIRDYFEFERQMLAHMQHPAIAQIFDAGSDEGGRLYLVMEYVEGLSLKRWCKEYKLGLRQRVRILIRVAEGVQHAHQKGVVHRDLKPGNILIEKIDGQSAPKIIDFGIAARVGNKSLVEAAGTPGYMSPEQSSRGMDVDSRSDVYALGAILFELISGKRPHEAVSSNNSDTSLEPLRPSDRISTLTPEEFSQLSADLGTPPQRLRRALRDDLDWIVAKATQPDREQRYASAAAFAEDLQRWLDGYPPLAAPRQRLRILRKFVARNRFSVATAAALFLAVVAGLVGTTWAWHQAQRATAREQAVSHFLTDVLASVDPALTHDLDQALMRRVLDTASERIRTELQDEPEARTRIETTLARTYANLGDGKRAREHLEAAVSTGRANLGLDNILTLDAAVEMGNLLTREGELEQAEVLMREILPYTLAMSDPIIGPRLQSRLGWNLLTRGRLDEALPLLRESYETLIRRVGSDHPRSLDAGQYYAVALERNGQLHEAIALTEDLVARQEAQHGSDHPQTLALRNSLANFYVVNGDLEAGIKEMRSLIKIVGQQHGTAAMMLPVLQVNLARTLQEQGGTENLIEAGELYQQSLDAQLARSGPNNPQSIAIRRLRASWLADVGQTSTAREEFQAALDSVREVFGEDSPHMAKGLLELAQTEHTLGDLERARRHAESALALLKDETSADPDVLNDLQTLLNEIAAPSSSAL